MKIDNEAREIPAAEHDNAPVETQLRESHTHGQLLRDVLGFQFKLFLDGLRDVLLSPISIGAALFGALTSRHHPGRYFYRLLEIGYKTDRWINLFNTHNDENADRLSPDSFVRHAESIVLSEYQRKGAGKGSATRAKTVSDPAPDTDRSRNP